MISSTIITACRGRRWFDLDAVRSPLADSPGNRYVRKVSAGDQDGRQNATTGIDRETNKITADYDPAKSAGAPPLDWHVDGITATPTHDLNEEPMTLRYVVGDTRDVTATIPDGTVDLIFTSPPFLALRSYLPADHPDKGREIGSEPNPATFLDTLLKLTAEWGRVLAPHGTLAVELGDTYSGNNEPGWHRATLPRQRVGVDDGGERSSGYRRTYDGTVPRADVGWPLAKSLALIPQLYAVALAYGINPLTGQPSPAGRWRVRNWLAWHRPNPPVGALGDKWRPASSYITTACRGGKRWFDLDAVRTPYTEWTMKNAGKTLTGGRAVALGPSNQRTGMSEIKLTHAGAPPLDWHVDHPADEPPAAPLIHWPTGLFTDGVHTFYRCDCGAHFDDRNDWWLHAQSVMLAPPLDWHTDGDLGVGHIILTTQPYAGSHYATFPMDLPRKIIDCMCPRQVCRVCGTPRERVMEPTKWDHRAHPLETSHRVHAGGLGTHGDRRAEPVTLGWTDCGHDNWRPGHVLDPFAGTGTTLAAAQDLGRDATGIDIDEDNAWLARERTGMFLEIETFERPVVDTADL